MPQTIEFDGVEHEFPDDATDEEITGLLSQGVTATGGESIAAGSIPAPATPEQAMAAHMQIQNAAFGPASLVGSAIGANREIARDVGVTPQQLFDEGQTVQQLAFGPASPMGATIAANRALSPARSFEPTAGIGDAKLSDATPLTPDELAQLPPDDPRRVRAVKSFTDLWKLYRETEQKANTSGTAAVMNGLGEIAPSMSEEAGGAGLAEAMRSFEGMLSTTNAELAGLGIAEPVLGQVIGAGFGAAMTSEIAKTLPQIATALNEGDLSQAGRGLVTAGSLGLLATQIGAHTFGRSTGGAAFEGLRRGAPEEADVMAKRFIDKSMDDLLATPVEDLLKPEPIAPNAQQITSPTQPNERVQPPQVTTEAGGEVPAAEGGAGVPARGQGSEVRAEGEVTPLSEVWNRFQETETDTPRDLAREVNDMIGRGEAPESLREPLNAYVDAMKDDFENMAGRGDVEPFEKAFLDAVGRAAGESGKATEAPIENASGAVDLSPIQSAKTKADMFSQGGRLLAEANTDAELQAIQKAMKEWNPPEAKPSPLAGPALKPSEGEPLKGQIGEEHGQMKIDAAKRGEDFTDAEHGFHDKDGNFLSRTEGAQRALDTGLIDQAEFDKMMARDEPGMTSQDLKRITEAKAAEAPAAEAPTPAKATSPSEPTVPGAPPIEAASVMESPKRSLDEIYDELHETGKVIQNPESTDAEFAAAAQRQKEIREERARDHPEEQAALDAAAQGGQRLDLSIGPKAQRDTWTSATEDALPKNMKLKSKEGGFVDMSTIVDLGREVFGKIKDFAAWSAEMLGRFGDVVKPHLKAIWNSVSGQNIRPEARQSGSIFGTGFRKAKETVEEIRSVRKMTDLDKATGEHSRRMQTSFEEAHAAQKEIRKTVPKESRRNAISVWIEANGDVPTLQGWEAGAKGKVFKKAAAEAQSLTPEEIAIANRVKSAFSVLEGRGRTHDVLGAHRDNYVPHIWEIEKRSALSGGGKLVDKFRFNKARTFNTFAEGDAAGFTPKSLDISNVLPAYLSEMNKVIASRQFVEDISAGSAKDSRPLVLPEGRLSKAVSPEGDLTYLVDPKARKNATDAAGDKIEQSDYVRADQPALKEWNWEGKDNEGNPIYMKDNLLLHPEAAERLNAMIGRSKIKQWAERPTTALAAVPKAIMRGLDTAQQVMKREMFGLISSFHQVQEGWHAIGHSVNPFFNIPKIDLRGDAAQRDAARHGLMILPDKESGSSYLEGVGGERTLVSRAIRKGGKPGQVLSDVLDGYQDFLFQRYIPGLKVKTYEAIVGRNTKRFQKELASGELTEADIKALSATQTNAAYGHLNYAMLDRSPTMQHLASIALLAPDFLEARTRFTGQAAKSLAGSKAGNEQFKAIAQLALIQAGLAYTVAKLSGGDWDEKHPFEAKINGRRYTLRSVPEDLMSLYEDKRKFAFGRISPLIARGGLQAATGRNYRGESVSLKDTAEELLAGYIPIAARGIPGVKELTQTGRMSDLTGLEQLASTMGLRTSRYSPISQTHKLAHEWMKDQGLPEDKGVYPISKYQPLRYALEDGDDARVKEEYDKLLKQPGETRSKIQSGFKQSMHKPFTQSEAMDKKMRKSLKPEEQALFDEAVQKRKVILSRFYKR